MTERFRLLGVECEALELEDLNSIVAAAASADGKVVVANHNLNSVRLSHKHDEVREFYRSAGHIHIDGMPLVWAGRLLGYPITRRHRVTYVDWLPPLMSLADREGWRVFYLGGKPGVAESGAARLRQQFPDLRMRTHHGYFPASEDADVLDVIRSFDPHILFVGMGMPRQEAWILRNLPRIRARVILQAGACIDYVAGAIPTPPRWAGRLGLEWAFRLASEPRRLSRRYLVEPWFVLALLMRDVFNRRLRGTRRGATTSSRTLTRLEGSGTCETEGHNPVSKPAR